MHVAKKPSFNPLMMNKHYDDVWILLG